MEISAEKTKLMTNSVIGIQREIKVKGQKLGTVTNFQIPWNGYLRMTSQNWRFSRGLHKPQQLFKAEAHSWRDNNISFGSKMKLMGFLVISIFLYACESWILTADKLYFFLREATFITSCLLSLQWNTKSGSGLKENNLLRWGANSFL